MIRVVGLNPVIDRTYYINDFRSGVKFYEITPRTDVGRSEEHTSELQSQR